MIVVYPTLFFAPVVLVCEKRACDTERDKRAAQKGVQNVQIGVHGTKI